MTDHHHTHQHTNKWKYEVVKPVTIGRQVVLAGTPAAMTFNPGEIDRTLYEVLVQHFPDAVRRTSTNELIAAVQAVRLTPHLTQDTHTS